MTKLIFLGTSFVVPAFNHENTHLLILGEKQKILIDTGNNPTVRLKQVGLDPLELTDLLLTHFHPDHISGAPSLLLNSWILGRIKPLDIYGLDDTMQRFEKMMDLYQWENWPNFYPVHLHPIEPRELVEVFNSEEFLVTSSPVHHMIPAFGMRIISHRTRRCIVYSSDTEPCDEVVNLAEGADILIHEATGASLGHSSAAQAGEIASKARVKELYLIHYKRPLSHSTEWTTADALASRNSLVDEARTTFDGPVTVAEDFMELEF